MRALNMNETQAVAGGFVGPGMFDGLLEGAVALFGIGIACAFVLGVGSVFAYQYLNNKNN